MISRLVRRRFFSTSPSTPLCAPLSLYNSLTQAVDDLVTINHEKEAAQQDDSRATSSPPGMAFYTCGPTTYAPAHLGHARTYVCLDILRRVLEHNIKVPLLFVMNITDVDDKILNAAAGGGSSPHSSPLQLARHYEREFWKDMDALNCLRPHVVTRVTECMPAIVAYIQRLVNTKMTYTIEEDGVYFDVKAFEERMQHVTKYGKLAPPSASSDFYTRLVNDDSEEAVVKKKDPRDFCLWKLRQDVALYWSSPFGNGRPGWHIECSAMIEFIQQSFPTYKFVLHAGGVDLKFPHHTNEIAQAEAYHGNGEWIPHWTHTGHLHIDGRKMSKSLKNFVTIQELLESNDATILSSPADDFRLWCLMHSYRSSVTYSKERILEARRIRLRIVDFMRAGHDKLAQLEQQDRESTSETPTTSSSSTWTATDHEFFQMVTHAKQKAHLALQFSDLDTATFLDEVLRIVSAGQSYVTTSGNPHQEPLRYALDTLGRLLSLVGFTDKTTGCLERRDASTSSSSSMPTNLVVGGERALLDELVRFRAAIRQVALRKDDYDNALYTILRICDEARDSIFPALGVEVMDGNNEEESSWKIRLRDEIETDDATSLSPPMSTPSLAELEKIPLCDFFRVGQYEGQFSDFDESGLPTRNADGSPVSNKQRKRLTRKLQKHAKRLGQCVDDS